MKEQILCVLSPAYPWKDRLFCFPSLGSTNDHLRTLARNGAPEGTAVIADHQTGGHGRRGRHFHSPEGCGIYLSYLLRPQCPPERLMHLTCAAAVSMCDAVERCASFRPGIKWTNDLVSGTRKLGGILTELGFDPQGNVDWVIVGVGINCTQTAQAFPPEIRDMAGSIAMVTGIVPDRAALAGAMLESLHEMSQSLLTRQEQILAAYRRDCITVDKDVVLVRGDQRSYGHAVDICDDGSLLVRFRDGSLQRVNSGEVSVRGMYGYL